MTLTAIAGVIAHAVTMGGPRVPGAPVVGVWLVAGAGLWLLVRTWVPRGRGDPGPSAAHDVVMRVARIVGGADGLFDSGPWSAIAEEVAELHPGAAVAFVRFGDRGQGHVVGSAGPGAPAADTMIVLDRGPGIACVFRDGLYAACADCWRATSPQSVRRIGLNHGVALPLTSGGRIWGSLSIAAADLASSVPPPDDPTLSRIADLASVAVAAAEARAALARGHSDVAAVLDGLPAPVWVRDAVGALVLVNRAFVALAALQADRELAGIADPAVDAATLAGAEDEPLEVELTDPMGARRTLLVARSVLRDADGAARAVCGVATDISERRELERAKDEFVSVVSHELRTPLSSIRGALALLADPEDDLEADDRSRMLSIAANNTERLGRVINDVLDLQRIRSGLADPKTGDCFADELVHAAAEMMAPFATARDLTIEVSASHAQLVADADQIVQVLCNLLSNAVKFSEPGNPIRTGAAQVGEEIRFFVEDRGRGIPADALERIFERFFQVDSSDSRRNGGTGLGLAIAREIGTRHGGRLWAESEAGVGSRFWLALPAAAGPILPVPGPNDRGCALICDGDPAARRMACEALQPTGFSPLEVGTGAAAVSFARSRRPRVILVDAALPGNEGLNTVRTLALDPETRDIPVILTTTGAAHAGPLPPQVVGQLTKPYAGHRLSEILTPIIAAPPVCARVMLVTASDDVGEELAVAGHAPALHTRSAVEAMSLLAWEDVDVVVLDLDLPDLDAVGVADVVCREGRTPPGIVAFTEGALDPLVRPQLQLGNTVFIEHWRACPERLRERLAGVATATRASPRHR